jgi:hypothetical protein
LLCIQIYRHQTAVIEPRRRTTVVEPSLLTSFSHCRSPVLQPASSLFWTYALRHQSTSRGKTVNAGTRLSTLKNEHSASSDVTRHVGAARVKNIWATFRSFREAQNKDGWVLLYQIIFCSRKQVTAKSINMNFNYLFNV